jgi:hypothetical protein
MVRLGLGWTVLPITVRSGGPEPIVIGPEIVERVLVLARRSETILDPAVVELEQRLHAPAPAPVPRRRATRASTSNGRP